MTKKNKTTKAKELREDSAQRVTQADKDFWNKNVAGKKTSKKKSK